jgi:protein-S-isoprenylcysteine O-methyltransferase Ste14
MKSDRPKTNRNGRKGVFVRTASYMLRLMARWAIITAGMSILLLVASGSARLPSLRNYLVMVSAFLLGTLLVIDPGLVEERSRTTEKSGTSDRFAASITFLATLVFAALDVGRLHWSPMIPSKARLGSLLLVAAASSLQMWAMVVNPFFSPDIRLQPERGHRLITRGPYRLLRHPGYLAMLLSVPAGALAIGSWLALVPAAVFCLVILKRVGAEEQFLQRNLAGYTEHTDSVRGQLFPRMLFRDRPRQHSASSNFACEGPDRGWP